MSQEARTGAGGHHTAQKPAAAAYLKRKKSSHTQNDLMNGHSVLSSSNSSSSNNTHNATWMTAVQVIDPRNTFEITKALKTNICRFFKSNKIDIAAQAAHQKEHRPMSVLDSFTPKPKYFQASFYPYEEPSSGEQSPLLPLSSDESEGNQQFRSSDEEEEGNDDKSERRNKRNRKEEQRRRRMKGRNSSSSNSSNRHSRSSSSSNSSSSRSNTSSSRSSSNSNQRSSSSSSSNSKSNSSQNRSNSNGHKKHKKSNKSSRSSSSSRSSCSNASPKYKTIKNKDTNQTPAYEEEYNNNASHEDIDHQKQQKNQLSSLLNNSAGQRKTQASVSANSATNSQQKPKISQEAQISQEGTELEQQIQGEAKKIESSKKQKQKHKEEKNKKKKNKKKETSHSKRNHQKEQSQSQSKRHPKSKSKRQQSQSSQSHPIRSQLFKERASVEDVVMNLFESQSHEITQSLSAAENHPSIPKLYIEDPLQECDPDAVYKIAVTIARRHEARHRKHRISNFTVFSVRKQSEEGNTTSSSSQSVRVLLLEFYKKTTALRVGMALEKLSQHYPYQLDAADYHYLPSSLSFKWALDRKKQTEFSQSYFSCVIRNLPEECSESRLKSFIQAKTASSVRILSVEETRLIKNSICSIVRVASFEEAEHLCVVLNRSLYPSYSSTLRVKCHLHPECCHARTQAAREDPTKLYFTPKSPAVRCKLIKCRMDSQWMDCKSKEKMRGITVKGQEGHAGDSDEGLSSNEESFPEYASLYEGNNADKLRQKLPTPREAIQSILKNTSCLFAGSQPIPPMPKATTNPPAVFESHPSRNMPSSIRSESMAQQQQQQQQSFIYSSNNILASLKLAVSMNNSNKDNEESLKGRKPQDISGLEAAPGKKMKRDSHEEEEGSLIASNNSIKQQQTTQPQSNFPTTGIATTNPMNNNSNLRAFPQVSQQPMQQQSQQPIQQQSQQLTQPNGAIITPHPLLLSSNSQKNLGPHQSTRQVVLPLPSLNPPLPPPPPPGFVHQHLVHPALSQIPPQAQFQQQQPSLPQPQQQFQQQQGFAGRGGGQPLNAIPMQHMMSNNNPLVQQQQQQQQHHQHLPSNPAVIAMPRIPQQQQQPQQPPPPQFIQGQGIVSHSQFPQGQVVQPNPSQYPNVQHPQMSQQQQPQQFMQQHQQQPLHHPHLAQQPPKHYMIPPPQQYAAPIAQPPIGFIQQPPQMPQPVIAQVPQMAPPVQSYPSVLISQQPPRHLPTAPDDFPSPSDAYQPMPPAGTTPKTPSLPPSPPSDIPSPE